MERFNSKVVVRENHVYYNSDDVMTSVLHAFTFFR